MTWSCSVAHSTRCGPRTWSQSPPRPLVAPQLLRLVVRPVRAADLGPLVPVEAEPAEAVEDGLQRLGDVALLVGVVDAQDELAAVLAGEQPVEKGRADAADVQVAGRAGGESRANHVSASVADEWTSGDSGERAG